VELVADDSIYPKTLGVPNVDLDRLKIADQQDAPQGRWWRTLLLCVICTAAGSIATALVNGWRGGAALRVRTVVVRPAPSARGQRFTAGGWIEATTPAYPIVVTCRISERLTELLVHQGQMVEPKAVIARLYDRDIKSRLAVARARHEAAKRTLDKLRAGFRREDVLAAEAKVAERQERVRIAKANHERSKGLKPGAISKEELDKEYSAVRRSEAEHAAAVAELAKQKAGYRREDIAAAEASVNEAAALVDLAELELSYCTISAPDVGRPLRVLKVLHHVGEWIDAKKEPALVWLYDPKDMQVRVDVTQANIKAVEVGAEALVATEADRARKYQGRVLRAEPLAELAKNTVTVRVKIEDPDELLFPEMVAHVTFLAGRTSTGKPKGLVVPKEAVVARGDDRYVFLCQGDCARQQEIVVSNDLGGQVLVGQGLQSGQRVIVTQTDRLRDGQQIEEE